MCCKCSGRICKHLIGQLCTIWAEFEKASVSSESTFWNIKPIADAVPVWLELLAILLRRGCVQVFIHLWPVLGWKYHRKPGSSCGKQHSSLTYEMDTIECRNISAELKPSSWKAWAQHAQTALCLPAWLNPKNILLHKWELLKPPFHLQFLHPVPSQLCCFGLCE